VGVGVSVGVGVGSGVWAAVGEGLSVDSGVEVGGSVGWVVSVGGAWVSIPQAARMAAKREAKESFRKLRREWSLRPVERKPEC
jgi:hypothetical protein